MIISHKHKFIFIKIRKTAGSSIEASLVPHCTVNDIITPLQSSPQYDYSRNWESAVPWWRMPLRIQEMFFWKSPIQHQPNNYRLKHFINGNLFNHMRARDIKACIPRHIWNSYYKFCCERNPWDKMLSRYCWNYKSDDNKLPNAITDSLFEEFIQKSVSSFPPISDFSFYSDTKGQVMVDKILRFENINADFDEVSRQLGIDYGNKGLNIQIKHSNKNDALNYRNIYTQEQQQLIAKHCAKEIELLEYSF